MRESRGEDSRADGRCRWDVQKEEKLCCIRIRALCLVLLSMRLEKRPAAVVF